MITRRLGPEEYHKLQSCPWLEAKRCPHPETSVVMVAEDDEGQLAGFVAAQLVLCTEPVWIAPKQRKGWVLLKLYEHMKKELKELGVTTVTSHASNEETASYLERFGFKAKNFMMYEKEL